MRAVGRSPGTAITYAIATVVSVLLGASPAMAAEFDKFGFETAEAQLSTHEAGGHPDITTRIVVKTDPKSPTEFGEHSPYARLKDVIVDLPPGLIGNLNAVDRCTTAQFVTGKNELGEGCPLSSQVGVSESRLRGANPGLYAKSPIFNLESPDGSAVARFGFLVLTVPVFIDVHLRSDSDYGVTAKVTDLSAASQILEVKTVLWGVPADSSHDRLRFTPKEALESKQESLPRSSGRALEPFLSNPTTCGQPLEVGFAADSYQEPGRLVNYDAPLGEITGCDKLGFEPSLSLVPTSREAAAPSGADAILTIPQDEAVNGRSTSQLRDAVIRLPEGVSISPGAADGLAACSEAEVGFHVAPPPPANCPEASKIASAEIDSPSLTQPIHGAVYQRTPVPGHLTRAWLVADELGVHVKIPGEFQLDPVTGRVTSLFLETPQVPVRELNLHFKGGARGVLATPRSCGTYQTEYELTPWSGGAEVRGSSPMTFDQNCATGGFAPKLEAGSVNPVGGAFSSLITSVSQASGEQNLSQIHVTMPAGVLANLKGVVVCTDSDAPRGSCPDGSLIGHTAVASGPGPSPLWIPQPTKEPTAVYLAGPYGGGPYSLVVKTPAQAGPFDLGEVVVRVALRIDPETAQVTAVSDPLPQILEGIPITYRSVNLELDRPEFALNPTSCDPMQATGTATSVGGAAAALANHFQVANCSRLAFKPKLKLSLKGETQRAGDPALRATLTIPPHGANIAWTRVTLPGGEAIDNAHINNPCTRVQFNANACPKKSILGRARAITPLLDQPLAGPVYFRSNGGDRQLPDIVADLRGPIHVVLVGFIDSKNGKIRNTFAQLPDAPVSKFTLDLFGGKRGLIENDRDICKTPNRAVIQFNGQNGKIADSRPLVSVSCGKGKAKNR